MGNRLFLSHSDIHRSYCCIFKCKQTELNRIKLSGNENRYHHSNIY